MHGIFSHHYVSDQCLSYNFSGFKYSPEQLEYYSQNTVQVYTHLLQTLDNNLHQVYCSGNMATERVYHPEYVGPY